MALLSTARFKHAVRCRRASTLPQKRAPFDVIAETQSAVLRKDYLGVAPISVDDQTIRFTISTANLDRDMDTISVEGWDLTAYRSNPVVLWAHDSWSLPIGRCVEIGPDQGALMATVKFVPPDMPEVGPMAEAVRRMLLDGFLSATSVGFRPLEYDVSDDPARNPDDWFPGIDFQRQELMEFSVVPVPANAEALIDPAYRVDPSDVLGPLLDPNVAAAATARMKDRRRRQQALLALT